MCGIIGIINYQGLGLEAKDLDLMLASIRHRGPDQMGIFQDERVLLGHNRLSIIDLSDRAKQPMSLTNQGLIVIFNGEIYNFQELQKQLQKKGARFFSQSDTEVILWSYLFWPNDFLKHLNGMFALAIYEQKTGKLILARDRFGEKPLFYGRAGGSFFFTSELKALLPVKNQLGLQENLEQTNKFFTFGYVPAPFSILKNIFKVLPGEQITFDLKGEVQKKFYWQPPLGECQESFSKAKEAVIEQLRQSISRRLVADVPVGVFLSGGIDSSLIAALAKEIKPDLKTFSVIFEDPSFDESHYSQLAARHIGTEHTFLRVREEDALRVIANIGQILDEPFADMSLVPTFLLSKLTRKHVKVALGGDGADELFLGYPTHLAHKLVKGYHLLPYGVRRAIQQMVHNLPPNLNDFSLEFKLKRFTMAAELPLLTRHFEWQAQLQPSEKRQLLLPNQAFAQSFLQEIENNFLPQLTEHKRVEQADLFFYLANDILPKVDLASMANSLEARSPYLDHSFASYVLKLPINYRFTLFQSKKILKAAAKDYLPSKIVFRKKHGFGLPLGKWLQKELKEFVLELLGPNQLQKSGIFDPKGVTKLINDHMSGQKDCRKPLWAIITYLSWKQRFNI